MADGEEGIDAHPVVVVLHAHLRGIVAQEAPYPAAVQEAGANEVVLHPVQALGGARQVDDAAARVRAVQSAPAGVGEQLAAVVNHIVVGIDHAGLRLVLQRFHQPLQHGRLHEVVRRSPAPELAPRLGEAVAQRLGQALVRLGEAAQPGIARLAAGAEAGQGLLHMVGGAVVNDDELQLPVGLRQDALQGVHQEVRLVMHWQDHADQPGHQAAALRRHAAPGAPRGSAPGAGRAAVGGEAGAAQGALRLGL